jgi:hypothetical protein
MGWEIDNLGKIPASGIARVQRVSQEYSEVTVSL